MNRKRRMIVLACALSMAVVCAGAAWVLHKKHML